MRAKLPYGCCVWPAFWLLGSNFYKGTPWPLCGEIDIMEMVGGTLKGDSETLATLHWKSEIKNGHDCSGIRYMCEDGRLCDDYHIYAVEWSKDKLVWFFDETIIHEVLITGDMMGSFNKPHFILINTALEGWNKVNTDDIPLPQNYYIDYIKVYQED